MWIILKGSQTRMVIKAKGAYRYNNPGTPKEKLTSHLVYVREEIYMHLFFLNENDQFPNREADQQYLFFSSFFIFSTYSIPQCVSSEQMHHVYQSCMIFEYFKRVSNEIYIILYFIIC